MRDVGEFVINVATYNLREALNVSSAPAGSDVDEFELARLTKEPSQLVRPPRVKESPLHLECRLAKVISMPGLLSAASITAWCWARCWACISATISCRTGC